MTKKKPGNKKQQKSNKTVKSVEKKLKKLAVSNESEPVVDIGQEEKPEEIDGDQLEQNNEDINVEKESPTTTVTEEEKTEEIDKSDDLEMKEVTRRHLGRKDNNPKNQKSKKHYKKSAEEQHLPIEKSSNSNGNKSNSQQSKGKQNSKQDNISANRDYSKDRLPTEEQPISGRDRSASGDRRDHSSSSKHADKEQKTDARGRSKSGSRQDKASSSKGPDFSHRYRGNQNTRQDKDKYGNRQNSSSSFRNPKSKISEQERSTNETPWNSSDSSNKFQEYQNPRQNRRPYRNHPNNNSSKNANNFKGQQAADWKRGSSWQDANSSKNQNFNKEYERRKEEDSNRFSNESKRENYNKYGNKSDNRQDWYNQSRHKSHRERSRSNNRQSYNETKNDTPNETDSWEDFEDSSINFSNSNIDTSQNNSWVDDDNRKMPQQRKSRDSNRSSNLNDSQMNQSLKEIDARKLFYQYEKEFFKTKNKEYHRVKEIFGDLFEAPEDCSLGHCVAEDMGMGSGIAVQFRQKFRQVDELLDQRQKQGGLAVLKDKDRFIYYLVTKQVSNGKPTYQSLFKSLCKMKNHIIENGVTKLALPRIGCGLDRLEWEDVKYMLEFLFRDVDIEIIIYNFQQDNESTTTTPTRIRNCKVVHENYPIEEIAPETIIIYLSSEDGEVTEEMENLDKKFAFLNRFKFAPKRIGEIIKFETNNFYLYGCIVKKTKDDLINFKSLQRCISKINGENRKLKFVYVGFQAIDNPDEIINNKIINILRNTFHNVDVYVCYPEKLRYLIPPSRDSFY